MLARTFGDLGGRKAKGAVRLASWPFPVVWTLYGAILAVLFAAGLRAALAARRLADARAWLRAALALQAPDHPWLLRL